jgi:hypothetical protein
MELGVNIYYSGKLYFVILQWMNKVMFPWICVPCVFIAHLFIFVYEYILARLRLLVLSSTINETRRDPLSDFSVKTGSIIRRLHSSCGFLLTKLRLGSLGRWCRRTTSYRSWRHRLEDPALPWLMLVRMGCLLFIYGPRVFGEVRLFWVRCFLAARLWLS